MACGFGSVPAQFAPPPGCGGQQLLVARLARPSPPLPHGYSTADAGGGSRGAGDAPPSPPLSGGGGTGGSRASPRRVSPVPSLDAQQRVQADVEVFGDERVVFSDRVLHSAGRSSSSPEAAAQWEWDGEEAEGGDGEVESSYKGSPFDAMDALDEVEGGDGEVQSSCKGPPLDTMDALQEALPYRKGVSKFYNSKSGSFAKPPAAVIPSPPSVKVLPKPETPSPRKRKGLLPFSFKWGKAQNKEVYPEYNVLGSPMTCRRMTLSPAATSSSGSNSGSDDEAQKLPPHRPPRRSGSGSGSGLSEWQ